MSQPTPDNPRDLVETYHIVVHLSPFSLSYTFYHTITINRMSISQYVETDVETELV